jgi:4-hydroxybenzoate polyprenyltransferase
MKEGKFKEYAKLIRLPALGISVIAVFGAVTVKGSTFEFSHFIMLFLVGIFFNIGGFVYNDYKDIYIDRFSEESSGRPLVRGTISTKIALSIVGVCLMITFIIPLIFFGRFLPIMILIISIIFIILYNIFNKKLMGSDVFLAGAAALFCLFGALAVSDSIQGLQGVGGLTWVVVVLVFIEIFFMNAIEGDLRDIKSDRKTKVKTLAVYLGVKLGEKMYIPISFKALALLLKFSAGILVFIPFIFFDLKYFFWQIILLGILLIGMLSSAIKMLNMRSFNRKKLGNYFRIQELCSYYLLLIMLLGFIGVGWTLLLIFFPMIWFLLFNYALFGNFFTPAY